MIRSAFVSALGGLRLGRRMRRIALTIGSFAVVSFAFSSASGSLVEPLCAQGGGTCCVGGGWCYPNGCSDASCRVQGWWRTDGKPCHVEVE